MTQASQTDHNIRQGVYQQNPGSTEWILEQIIS